jgi:hypothetical protein
MKHALFKDKKAAELASLKTWRVYAGKSYKEDQSTLSICTPYETEDGYWAIDVEQEFEDAFAKSYGDKVKCVTTRPTVKVPALPTETTTETSQDDRPTIPAPPPAVELVVSTKKKPKKKSVKRKKK